VLLDSIDAELTPIRRRAEELEATPQLVDDVLSAGAGACRAIAKQTMKDVRERMGLD
jgi:tryptophanyl-tRNA synthetase